MKKLFLLVFVFCALKVNAQDYLISFAGTGASTTVNTVMVENLIAGTSLTLNGNDILHLTVLTGVNSIMSVPSSEMKIYPNPMTDKSVLQIYPPVAGEAFISVLDMSGKLVFKNPVYLENHPQEFNLSGLKSGFYVISVKGNNYQYSGKLLSNGNKSGTINLEKISNNKAVEEKKTKSDSKGVQATIDMNYTIGDMLKFTGISGNYRTVKNDIPASNETITFNFIACTDGDNINYSVVTIGTQVWMAENLMTRKYLNGDVISPGTSDDTYWSTATWGVYCWYNNDAATYKNVYGALYNWYAVSDARNLCPSGWHVPSDVEWTTLTQFFGGLGVAGGKLKSTTGWASPNEGATDEVGFSALPGGFRQTIGYFDQVGYLGYWWSSSEAPGTIPLQAWYRFTQYITDDAGAQYTDKTSGFSVRCVKN